MAQVQKKCGDRTLILHSNVLFDPNAKKSQICSGSHIHGLFYVHGTDFAWAVRLAALQRSLWGGKCFRFRCFQEHFYSTSKQWKVQSCLILHPINGDNWKTYQCICALHEKRKVLLTHKCGEPLCICRVQHLQLGISATFKRIFHCWQQ